MQIDAVYPALSFRRISVLNLHEFIEAKGEYSLSIGETCGLLIDIGHCQSLLFGIRAK